MSRAGAGGRSDEVQQQRSFCAHLIPSMLNISRQSLASKLMWKHQALGSIPEQLEKKKMASEGERWRVRASESLVLIHFRLFSQGQQFRFIK